MARTRLSVVAERPVVALCAAKDCRKRSESTKIRSVLDKHCDVVDLKCIGLCNGPAVAIDPTSETPTVYSKLRTKRHRVLLLAAIVGDDRARRELAGRQITKKKVLGLVTRQFKRRRATVDRAA